ncbi:hypothetical protein [Nocardia pseudovaccinii]|uniref:hypothetical protein n=1 Tax=Nocardia pseudovaccinii TaxID=189540 RepID=UPI0007A4C660|nr:hypothetical protein [Nocardia pseudovaccinii]
MTDPAPLAQRYEELRDVAIRLLDVLDDAEGNPQMLRSALEAMHQAVRGDGPPETPDTGDPIRDPARHLLTRFDYTQGTKTPVTLDEEAANIRRELAGDRAIDDRPPGEPDREVRLTELRGMIIGGLLRELAARLSRGSAFGPSRAGEELAQVATDLSWEVLDQTFVGRQ